MGTGYYVRLIGVEFMCPNIEHRMDGTVGARCIYPRSQKSSRRTERTPGPWGKRRCGSVHLKLSGAMSSKSWASAPLYDSSSKIGLCRQSKLLASALINLKYLLTQERASHCISSRCHKSHLHRHNELGKMGGSDLYEIYIS